jgi:uncharacterized protein YdeI (YjbR/CyaY-like superfamily)
LVDPSAAPVTPAFFATPSELRTWLEEHHAESRELWVGFYKKGSGKPSITWPEAVDQALCFGWIDGVRKRVDDYSYAIRFTPRKRRSTWSAVNIARIKELTESGMMRPEGLEAFERRSEERSGIYSYEQRDSARLDDAHEQQFRRDREAWDFFRGRAMWYRKAAIWWVTSAKKEETRLKRLAKLIEDSREGRTIPQLTRPPKRHRS